MTERDDVQQLREQKLADLVALGLPYFPTRYGPTRRSRDIQQEYDALEGQRVRVAGRLMRIRLMGKAAFAHILDGEGELQLYFKRDVLGEALYDYFKLLDLGDIIGAEGKVFKTRTGEVTVEVQDLVLLAKSYRPLPDKWHGMTDLEMRYRRRYLDLISNQDARRIFYTRSALVRALREYLDSRGFIEVETPILQPLYGGAAATPFTTHYESLDMDAYLRIATELYLKRLIVGGMERVYEIGKDFRNEGFSRKHSPEFTMVEIYQAYVDYTDIMALTEDMFSAAAQRVLGSTTFPYQNHEINLMPPWRRLTIRDALVEYAGIDIEGMTADDLEVAAQKHGISFEPGAGRGKLIEELVSSLVEPHLIQPTFLCDYPVDFPGSLLAKRKAGHPDVVERFEAYAGGMELANAFTELNDPRDQELRMEEAARRTGEEYANVDRDYILALEHGMPPTGGIGFGIDRLMLLFADVHNIREIILFPLLRPREDVDAQP